MLVVFWIVASLLSFILIFQVVVPLSNAIDFAAIAPTFLLLYVKSHLSFSPPKVNSKPVFKSVILLLSVENVELTAVKILSDKAPNVTPFVFEAITNVSPTLKVLASVTNSYVSPSAALTFFVSLKP